MTQQLSTDRKIQQLGMERWVPPPHFSAPHLAPPPAQRRAHTRPAWSTAATMPPLTAIHGFGLCPCGGSARLADSGLCVGDRHFLSNWKHDNLSRSQRWRPWERVMLSGQPRGRWILYINNLANTHVGEAAAAAKHISCGVSVRWGELVWTVSPCFPSWGPGGRATGMRVCVCECVCMSSVWGPKDGICWASPPPAPQGPTQAPQLLEGSLTTWHPSSATLLWKSVCCVRHLTLYFVILSEGLGLNPGSASYLLCDFGT